MSSTRCNKFGDNLGPDNNIKAGQMGQEGDKKPCLEVKEEANEIQQAGKGKIKASLTNLK